MTILFLSLIEGSPVFVPLLILKQVGYGLLFGFSMAYFIKTWLKYFDLKKDSLAIVFLFAIAFAIMAMNTGYGFSLDIYHLVFGICSLSLLLQGSLMPTLTRKLAMIDDQDSVLRTFNYYVDKGDISFIKTTIKEDSPFVGKKLAETSIQGDFILAKIIRGGKAIVPRGEVVPLPGDRVILFQGEGE